MDNNNKARLKHILSDFVDALPTTTPPAISDLSTEKKLIVAESAVLLVSVATSVGLLCAYQKQIHQNEERIAALEDELWQMQVGQSRQAAYNVENSSVEEDEDAYVGL